MRIGGVLILLAALSAVVVYGVSAPSDEGGEPGAQNADPLEERGPSGAPMLEAGGRRKDAKGDDGPPARIRELVEATKTSDLDRQHAAVLKLKALHEKEPFPLRWFLAWALLEVADGESNELVGFALAVLKENDEVAVEFLGEILAAAVGASEAKQEAIARVLGRLGELRSEDVPIMVRIFEHEASGYEIKDTLVDLMDGLGADALPLAPSLIAWIEEVLAERAKYMEEARNAGIHVSWDHVEYDVERLLGAMGDAVVPMLAERLREMYARRSDEDDPDARSTAGLLAGGLGEAGDAGVHALVALLRASDADLRQEVMWSLTHLDDPPPIVRDALIGALTDSETSIRKDAAEALSDHAGDAVVAALLRAANDKRSSVREAALESLSELGVDFQDVLQPLLDLIEKGDRGSMVTAAESIARFGVDAMAVLPRLLAGLARVHGSDLRSYASAVAKVAALRPQLLAEAWSKASDDQRRRLIRVVGDAMPEGEHAQRSVIVGLVQRALREKDLYLRVYAAWLLAAPGRRDLLEPLTAGFRSNHGLLRTLGTEGIAEIGVVAAHLLTEVIERLQKGTYPHQARAGWRRESGALSEALEALGPTDLPRMFELIDHENFDLSYHAAEVIEALGAEAYPWLAARWSGSRYEQKLKILEIGRDAFHTTGKEVRAIEAAAAKLLYLGLGDKSPQVRLAAAEALARDAPSADRVMPVLIALLDEKDDETTEAAAHALAAYGPGAKSVRAGIEAHKNHANKSVGRVLRRLLEAIAAGT